MALTWTHKERGEIRVHENVEELSIDLVDYIAEISEASIKEHGSFCIALSGGSLITFISKLAEPPYNKIVDWAKWYVFWVDERMVSKSHDDSNYKLAKDNLLSKVNVFPRHICSINDTVSVEEAAAEYEFAIRQMVRSRTVTASENSDCPKFDLILLGIGSDGHVASLFPNHPALEAKDDWVTFLTNSPKPPPERITFTLPVINSAANVAVVAIGESKANAIHLAIDDLSLPDSSLSLPARLVYPSDDNLIWFMDKPAASKLDRLKLSE
ncbi:unnamed protein product [Cochlearia groenlandica]